MQPIAMLLTIVTIVSIFSPVGSCPPVSSLDYTVQYYLRLQ
jgi:hypothetical protein